MVISRAERKVVSHSEARTAWVLLILNRYKTLKSCVSVVATRNNWGESVESFASLVDPFRGSNISGNVCSFDCLVLMFLLA